MRNDEALIQEAEEAITAYLDEQLQRGAIDTGLFEKARQNVIRNLRSWLEDLHIDVLSPHLKQGIRQAIEDQKWPILTEVFVDEITFGTAGIRGKAAMTDDELHRLNDEGLERCKWLTMSVFSAIIFSAFHFEHDDFRMASLFGDPGCYGRS